MFLFISSLALKKKLYIVLTCIISYIFMYYISVYYFMFKASLLRFGLNYFYILVYLFSFCHTFLLMLDFFAVVYT